MTSDRVRDLPSIEPTRDGGAADDRGAALVLVMAWTLLMLGLALVVAQAVVRQIVPSGHTENTYAALGAAEAGIDTFRAHMYDNPLYYNTTPTQADDPAYYDWTPLPGGDTNSEYRYIVDKTSAQAGGRVRVIAFGRSPIGSTGVVRSVEAVMSKRSTLDYVYMSDIETPSPDVPGAYESDDTITGTGFSGSSRALAKLLCSRRWYETGPSNNNAGTKTYKERNQQFCQWAGIYSSEKLTGNVHTNDIWRLDTSTSLTGSIGINGATVTSSCRTSAEGITSGECYSMLKRRYIDTSGTTNGTTNNSTGTLTNKALKSNNGAFATWDSVSSSYNTGYQGDTWVPYQGSSDPTGRNPTYADPLELPEAPTTLRTDAGETGCVYTGPTRIRFGYDAVAGPVMYVTSPDTKKTARGCDGHGNDGTKLLADVANPSTQPTQTVWLSDFTDFVVFVQKVVETGDLDTWQTQNHWLADKAPTCLSKFTGNVTPYYPYVIPSGTTERDAYFNTGVGTTKYGFPSQFANPSSPWFGAGAKGCQAGDLYVQGVYGGSQTIPALLTIVTDDNVIVTGSLRDYNANMSGAPTGSSNNAAATYGRPGDTSQNMLGIVSNGFTYLYRPMMDTNEKFKSDGTSYSPKTYYSTGVTTWVKDWKVSNAQNPVLNFSLLAVTQCFSSQDPYNGTWPNDPQYTERNGYIYFWGSLAQKYRCVVGSTGGYYKVYSYDTRIGTIVPPYMLELSGEPWKSQKRIEINPEMQNLQPRTYNVAYADDTYSGTAPTLLTTPTSVMPTVAWPPASDPQRPTISWSGTSITVDPQHAGPIIINYNIKRRINAAGDTVTDNRRLVINAQ